MTDPAQANLIRYLREELLVSADAMFEGQQTAIALAIRQQNTLSSQRHIIALAVWFYFAATIEPNF